MGFYGNVYYQLINSFYKLVGNNNGKNIKNYSGNNAISTDKLKSDIATEAVGRKGVINLDTGNYWIGITEGDKVDGLEIIHMPPTTSNTTLVKGVEYLGTEKPATVTAEMEAGGYIKTHEIKYDSAGHVASKAEKIYKLPKPEVTDRIAALETLVGLKSDGSVYPDSKKQTLHGFVSDNFSNVSTLKEYVGNWSNICDYWSDSSLGKKITVQQTIGKLDDLFSTEYGMKGSYWENKNNWNGLTGVIGPINKLWHAYDTDNNTPISLVNVLLKQKEANQDTANQVTQNHNTAQSQINGIAAMIGSQLNPNNTAFEEILALQNILKWPADSTTTVSAELARLEKKVNDDNATQTAEITNAYTAKANEITGALNNAVSTLNTTIAEKDAAVRKAYSNADNVLKTGYEAADEKLKAGYEAADATLSGRIDDANSTIGNNYTTLNGSIESLASKTDTKFSNVNEEITSLKEADGSLAEDINTAKEDLTKAYKAADTALKEELTAAVNSILGILDWSENADKTVSGEISNIVKTLGWDGDTETVKNKIAAVQTNLTNFIGTSTELHTALTKADTDLGARITNLDEAYKDADTTLGESITSLDEAYKAADVALGERITPLETDNNKLFTILGVDKEQEYTQENLMSRLSTAETQLETTKNQLEILGVDISKAEVDEDGSIKVNILDKIFNSIEEMKGNISQISSDITLIKEKMNELHSDNPPFSDDSNTGEEEI